MNITIQQMEYFVKEMKKYQDEHPKASIYYDSENSEIRITYPLPKDFQMFSTKDEDLPTN